MAGLAPVELTADCESCGLEAGVVETYDALVAACRFGLPARTSCKLCSLTTQSELDRPEAKALSEIPANRCPACLVELGPAAVDGRKCEGCGATAQRSTTKPARVFASLPDLERALDEWAERDNFPDRHALLRATFAVTSIEELFALLQERKRIEVLADPFANMGGRSGTTNTPKEPKPPPQAKTTTAPLMAPIVLPEERPPPSAPPRAIVYPLVSVIAADGEIHPEERELINRFLQGEGLAPLNESEICVHHPSAVAHLIPKERREDVVKLMCESAAVDGMPDESERRVIRAYATAWNVDDEKLDFWMWGYENMNTSLARGLWLRLRRFVLSARWSDDTLKTP